MSDQPDSMIKYLVASLIRLVIPICMPPKNHPRKATARMTIRVLKLKASSDIGGNLIEKDQGGEPCFDLVDSARVGGH